MIVTKTPVRVSFLGGGSDLPNFYAEEDGGVVTTAINKYVYINVKKKFDDSLRLSYSVTETVDNTTEIKHDLVRAALEYFGIMKSIEITSISDLPSNGTGMGSSSAFLVGLLNALYCYTSRPVDKETLADRACMIELDLLKKPIGKQDQYIAAYGGFNYIAFHGNGSVTVEPILCSPETIKELEDNILLLYTGITRPADVILKQQSENTLTDSHIKASIREMVAMAKELRGNLSVGNLSDLGRMLHEAWMLKSKFTKNTTNGFIDECYATAKRSGALGGKLLGAGGGGFLLIYADPDVQERIKQAMPSLRALKISLGATGSSLVYRD